MKNLQLFLIFLALTAVITVMPVNASGNMVKFPANQWKDTTSLVRSYSLTTGSPVAIPLQTYTPAGIPTPVYSGNDNGRTISLARNSVVKVQLDENPTTGYSWNVTESSGIQVLSSSYVSSAPGRFGAGGTHTWVLEITGTGTQQFSGIYKQPWMPESANDSTYTISFDVKE